MNEDCFVPSGAGGTPPESFPLTSVHTLETHRQRAISFINHSQAPGYDEDIPRASCEEQTFRHSGWAVRRAQIWQAFIRTGAREKRKAAFANCGSQLFLQQSEDGRDLHLSCNKCHDRQCVTCQSERAALIREKICQHVSGRELKMLTFTLRHSQTPLLDQIKRLYSSLTKLRRRESWKVHMIGGCGFLEIKLSERDGLWHVHMHFLCEAHFWDQKEISREWHAVTGDSSIVDVRRVENVQSASFYVTKYVTKPADTSIFSSTDRLDEFVIAIRGVKLACPFGTWKAMKLNEKPKLDVKWKSVASIDKLQRDAADGDVNATRFLEAAARKWPLFAEIFLDTA